VNVDQSILVLIVHSRNVKKIAIIMVFVKMVYVTAHHYFQEILVNFLNVLKIVQEMEDV